MGGERVTFGIKGAPVLQHCGTKPIARSIFWVQFQPLPHSLFLAPALGGAGWAPGAGKQLSSGVQVTLWGCQTPAS